MAVAIEPGLVIADRYRLVTPIGSGGMGAVWAAEHIGLGHTVAVKFLGVSVSETDDARQRFSREGKIAAQLGEQSRHICRVIDYGLLDDGAPYIVMERLKGEGLNQALRRERRLDPHDAREVVVQLCRALELAHESGVVHRDLKPANVFLCEDRDGIYVKLLDFGVAKARLDSDAGTITADGTVVGTPSYMSPEQFQNSAKVDPRSDLWAVAAIAYRCLVGVEPFSSSGGIAALAARIAVSEPVPPSSEQPDLPKEFDAFIARGLAKQPADRFQSARELSDAFVRAMAGEREAAVGPSAPFAAPPLPVPPSPATTEANTLDASASAIAPRSAGSSGRAGWVAAALLGAVVVAGGAFFMLRGGAQPASVAAPPSARPSAPIPVAPAPSASAPASAAVGLTVSASASAAPSPSLKLAPKPQPKPSTAPAKPSWQDDSTL